MARSSSLAVVAAVLLTFASPAVASAPTAGLWNAQGVVVSTQGFDNGQPTGTRLSRKWRVVRQCVPSACRFLLFRQAQNGVEASVLVHKGSHYVAVFRLRIRGGACDRSGLEVIKRRFVLTFRNAHTMTATETVTGSFPGCGPGATVAHQHSRLRWRATYLGA